MEDRDINKIENQKIKVSYLNNSIQDFLLPTSLDQFRRKVKKLFQIQNKIDDIFIIYKTQNKNQEEKEIFNEVKRENEYKTFLEKYNSDQILNDMIMIETDRVPDEISRENTKDFEEEIEELIKTHLRAAGERIKKSLTGGKELYPNCKKQDRICDKCLKVISGDMFKGVNDVRKKTYCEKCSYQYNFPMFIIH